MDVFAQYEDFVDQTHRAFNSKSTWLAFCASQDVDEVDRDRLWAEYSTGLSIVHLDGRVEPVGAIE